MDCHGGDRVEQQTTGELERAVLGQPIQSIAVLLGLLARAHTANVHSNHRCYDRTHACFV